MALIKCPECGKEISDKAKICIGCGYPIELLKRSSECVTANDEKEKTFVNKEKNNKFTLDNSKSRMS